MDRRLTCSLTVRLSPAQLERIRTRAANEHRTAGAYLRTRLHELHHIEEQEAVLNRIQARVDAQKTAHDQRRAELLELEQRLTAKAEELDRRERRILSF